MMELKFDLKGIVHPILSLIAHPHVIPCKHIILSFIFRTQMKVHVSNEV